jgi:hypothetical protein
MLTTRPSRATTKTEVVYFGEEITETKAKTLVKLSWVLVPAKMDSVA